jgi:rhamnogalacturonyl hydrolase YesR
LQADDRKIARAREVMEYEMSTPNNDYWWWADGLYMVMPVMTKLYKVTGNKLYLQKLYAYFSFAKNLMYDDEAGLFYRDAKYIYPKHKTQTGKKDFWARGNGWVFAGLAKVLQDLPETDAHRQEYTAVFCAMARALKNSQQAEGYWTRSILDKSQAPGYETSGTAFFTYGFLWGINHGILETTDYEKTALNAWKYLTTIALQTDWIVGYVQPIGESADQHKSINERSTSDFGVGAFLLAAGEKVKSIKKIKKDLVHGSITQNPKFQSWAKTPPMGWNSWDCYGPTAEEHEDGFVRSNKLQWYQAENASVSNGILTITGKRETVPNTRYEEGSRD